MLIVQSTSINWILVRHTELIKLSSGSNQKKEQRKKITLNICGFMWQYLHNTSMPLSIAQHTPDFIKTNM